MVLGLLFQPVDPFPDPVHAGQEIEFVGILFASIVMLVLLISLMLYYHNKSKDQILPQITILGFSYLISFEVLMQNFLALSPLYVIFFIVFQSVVFLQYALEFSKNNKNKSVRRY